VHDTHEQVGVAERLNRTKTELARAMLIDAKLLRYLWAEAMSHAIWIKNRSPTQALDGRSPYQAHYGEAPDLSKLVPFGMQAWVKIVGAGKLDSHAEPGYFVSFDSKSTGYRIYFPGKRMVKPEQEVIFNVDQIGDTVMIPGEVLSEGEKQKVIQDCPKQAEKLKAEELTNTRAPIPSDNDDDAATGPENEPANDDDPPRAKHRAPRTPAHTPDTRILQKPPQCRPSERECSRR
jgi:hypothetical protein